MAGADCRHCLPAVQRTRPCASSRVCVQVALVSKVEEEHRRFTVAKGNEFPPLVVCIFSAGSCACTGKSNERELIQTYTESESASLFLWSVLSQCSVTP